VLLTHILSSPAVSFWHCCWLIFNFPCQYHSGSAAY
jgi:hypothetical protein